MGGIDDVSFMTLSRTRGAGGVDRRTHMALQR